MAEKRMIKISLIDDDMFLDMSRGARLLYFDLNMRADDDGFITPNKVMRMTGATPEELEELKERQFVIPFESGVMVIRHWKMHNYLRKDTHHRTQYENEYQQLEIQEHAPYRLRSDAVHDPSTIRPRHVDVDKTRQDKTRQDKTRQTDKTRLEQQDPSVSQSTTDETLQAIADQFPTLDRVLEFFHDKPRETVIKAYNFYQSNGWKDSSGNPVRNWQKVIAVFIDNERPDRQTRQTKRKSGWDFKGRNQDYDQIAMQIMQKQSAVLDALEGGQYDDDSET